MATRKKKRKAAKKKAVTKPAAKSKRGRKVPAEETQLRISVYEAQEKDGFTNAEAAERAGMGLPAWNQWKQKHRKQSGVGPVKRGRKPGRPKAAATKAKAAPASGATRGRSVPEDQLRLRIDTYEAQLTQGFTNEEAAKRAGIGLPAWNQWKQKHRKSTGAGPGRRGRKPGRKAAPVARPAAPTVAPVAALPTTPAQVDEFLENARLRGRVAELEAMLEALAHIFEQFRTR